MLPPAIYDYFTVQILTCNFKMSSESFSSLGKTKTFPNEEKHSVIILREDCFVAYFLAKLVNHFVSFDWAANFLCHFNHLTGNHLSCSIQPTCASYACTNQQTWSFKHSKVLSFSHKPVSGSWCHISFCQENFIKAKLCDLYFLSW